MKRLFISTTNNLDSGKAVAYYGVVSSHIVAGTGFLSDFAASVSDLFGGRSGSYRRQLESLYDEALDEVSEKAHLLGANAVLGLKIDIDNISGKGMSMFMITAVGTAARVEFEEKESEEGTTETVTSTVLLTEISKRAILKSLSDDNVVLPTKTWKTILKFPDDDYVIPLTKRYLEVSTHISEYLIDYVSEFKKNFGQFVQLADRNLLIQALYEGAREENTFTLVKGFISELHLFDAKSILCLIKEGHVRQAVALLGNEQPRYNDTDLKDMMAVIEAINNLPDVGKKEIVKGGIFSKEGEKYICQHGHINNPDEEFCSECGENIKGLDRNDLELIEQFKNRVAVLRDLLSK